MTSETDRLLVQATRLLQAGRVPEAIAAHRQLLALKPELADSWYNLGYLLQLAGEHEPALQAYGQALQHGIAGAEEVHLNRATLLADQLARPKEAEQELLVALGLNARFLPAWVNLGNLYEQTGERQRALQAYQKGLAVDPDHALALSRLPNVAALQGPQDPLIDRLRQALARTGVTAAERADLGFGLGKALDAVGAYDEAFAAYSAANLAAREAAGPRAPRYDRAAHERFIDHLIATTPAPRPPQPRREGEPVPVFVCGMFRSGSTLVEQILASHPRVTGAGELAMVPALAAAVHRSGRVPAEPQLLQMRAAYLSRLAALHPGAELVVDKRPDNFLHLGLVKAMFPEARIVFTRRDPLDNCLAVFFLHLDASMPYAQDLLDIAHWYRQHERLMAHWRSRFGEDLHEVRYDELVVQPRPVMERLLAHCGLEWDEACLDFHRSSTVVRTPSAWQVRRPLYQGSSGRWRHYASHLRPLQQALGISPA